MANIFNSIFTKKIGSSNFDMSYDHKLTGNMGNLIPFHLQEAIPGDRFSLGASVMVRFAPILAPIMHKVDVYCHFFYVPNRILWPNWEKFITGGDTGEAAPVHPFINFSDDQRRSTLSDYLGIPSWEGDNYYSVNALPFAAYQRVYNDYYRDQNLVAEVPSTLVDGENTDTLFLPLRKRAWQHDYFTGALPFAQKGPAVQIPLGEFQNVPVILDKSAPGSQQIYRDAVTGDAVPSGEVITDANGYMSYNPGGYNANMDPNGTLQADMSEAIVGSTNITDLRNAFKLQEWLEKNARGGTRYVENLLVQFGVRSSDKRLDRPEFLGGSRQPIVVSEVLQTSSTDSTSPQANMAGHGISVGAGEVKPYFVEEHGFILGIMSVMPSTAYFQGLPRMFSRSDKLDYYWPSFQHIGEQAVLNKELYAQHDDPDGTFGYVPRYAEYKYMPSRVSGDFKDSLLYWHLARKFDTSPALNSQFINCDPSARIFAVTDTNVDHLYCHVFNSVKVRRRMAKYSNPGF